MANPQLPGGDEQKRLGHNQPGQAAAPEPQRLGHDSQPAAKPVAKAALDGPKGAAPGPEAASPKKASNHGNDVKLPMSGRTKVGIFKAAVATVALAFGAIYYGAPEKQKVQQLTDGVSPEQAAVAAAYRGNYNKDAIKLKPAQPGAPATPAAKPTATEIGLESIAASARKPSLEELTQTSPNASTTEKVGVYASALAVKATNNSSFMGGASMLGMLAAATAAMRLAGSRLLRSARPRTMGDASFSEAPGITSLVYGYGPMEKKYMNNLRESRIFESKFRGADGNKPGPEQLQELRMQERMAEVTPRFFPLAQKPQVQEVSGLTKKGEVYWSIEPKLGATVGEKLGVTPPAAKKGPSNTPGSGGPG